MRDPIEELKSFNDGPEGGVPVNPLSPADVRRAGDRLRRRRNAGAAVASVAALAVIATPFALLAGRDDTADGPPPLTPSETAGTWRTHIPDDFPLALGLPETNGDDGSPVTTSRDEVGVVVGLCGTDWFPTGTGVDRMGVVWTGEAEAGAGRALITYPDDAAARAAVDDFEQGVADCPVETSGETTTVNHERIPDVFGGAVPDYVVVANTYADNGLRSTGLDLYAALRVGNAVLLTFEYGEGGATDDTVGQQTDELREATLPVIDEMAIFDGVVDPDADALASMLLTEEEVPMGDPSGESWWAEAGTFPGEGTSDFLPCLGSLTDRGATDVAMRQFGSASGMDPAPAWTPSSGLVSMVAEFPDPETAVAAYDALADDLSSCRNAPFVDDLPRTSLEGPEGVDVGDAGARVAVLTFGPAGQQTEQWLEVGIATLENHIAIVSSVKRMHDEVRPQFETSPIRQMVASAAAHLPGPGRGGVDPGVTSGTDQPADDTEPACTADDLTITSRYLEGGAGHLYDELRFTNTGDRACFVGGLTSLQVVADGKAGPTQYSEEGDLVVIQPGAFASTVTDHSNPDNYDADTCGPAEPVTWLIEIPGSGDTLEIDGAGYGKACTKINTIDIQPWVLGSSSD